MLPVLTLILDDDLFILKAYSKLFNDNEHFKVKTFSKASQFLKEFDNSVKTANIDNSMPEMDGLDVLKEIMKINDECLVIIVSGVCDGKTVIKLMNYDAYKFVDKTEHQWYNELLLFSERAYQKVLKKHLFLQVAEKLQKENSAKLKLHASSV